jgi:rhodanese-related sulfurtransferase
MDQRRQVRTRLKLAVALMLAAAIACGPAASGRPTISNAELATKIKQGQAPLVLDVRSPEEFKSGHIPGAVNIPVDELGSRLGELKLAKGDEVVVHCERGARAAKAEALLQQSGYTDVVDLSGHMKGWREAGLPVE